MAVATNKKSTARASAKATAKIAPKKAAASKGHHSSHPSWIDMITECITAHPEDARVGVSRPTIKKYAESKYKIEINASALSQLNRAIAHGAEKGTFVLPKGPSGKVKLAPKQRSDAAKENARPIVKKTTAGKTKAAPAKPVTKTTTKKSTAARPVAKSKANAANGDTKPAGAATKRYTSAAKKGQAKKTVAASKKTSPAKKPAAARKASTPAKKGAAKKSVTGSASAKKASAKPSRVKSSSKLASRGKTATKKASA